MTDWLTCPRCFAYGAHLILDEHTIDCYDCRYVGVPERPEWWFMCLEERWIVLPHANGERARDSADVRMLLETIDLGLGLSDLGLSLADLEEERERRAAARAELVVRDWPF